MSGASIYPAVQNIILACRALGLGTVMTTNHLLCEDEVKDVLRLPTDVQTYALMPIGYPRNKFGPVSRRPVSEVAYADRWGNSWRGKNSRMREAERVMCICRALKRIPPVHNSERRESLA